MKGRVWRRLRGCLICAQRAVGAQTAHSGQDEKGRVLPGVSPWILISLDRGPSPFSPGFPQGPVEGAPSERVPEDGPL